MVWVAAENQILVVCASEGELRSLTDVLVSTGYGVIGFADVWQARRVADLPRIALAILDLPREDLLARDLVRVLRQGGERMKLLALTTAERANVFPGFEVDGIAVKPFPNRDLLRTVAALIGPPAGPPDRGGGTRTAA
jgi:DNA-binding response OmpR family regulator